MYKSLITKNSGPQKRDQRKKEKIGFGIRGGDLAVRGDKEADLLMDLISLVQKLK